MAELLDTEVTVFSFLPVEFEAQWAMGWEVWQLCGTALGHNAEKSKSIFAYKRHILPGVPNLDLWSRNGEKNHIWDLPLKASQKECSYSQDTFPLPPCNS